VHERNYLNQIYKNGYNSNRISALVAKCVLGQFVYRMQQFFDDENADFLDMKKIVVILLFKYLECAPSAQTLSSIYSGTRPVRARLSFTHLLTLHYYLL
jgi:hypothetical protein